MTTIEIDMDKKCKKCGKPGALKCGLCMPCFSIWMRGKSKASDLETRSLPPEPRPLRVIKIEGNTGNKAP